MGPTVDGPIGGSRFCLSGPGSVFGPHGLHYKPTNGVPLSHLHVRIRKKLLSFLLNSFMFRSDTGHGGLAASSQVQGRQQVHKFTIVALDCFRNVPNFGEGCFKITAF